MTVLQSLINERAALQAELARKEERYREIAQRAPKPIKTRYKLEMLDLINRIADINFNIEGIEAPTEGGGPE